MAPHSIEIRSSDDKRIPGFVLGILFFFPLVLTAAPLELAQQLFQEGNWQGARREAERVLALAPSNQMASLLVITSAARQTGVNHGSCLQDARRLAEEGRDPTIRAPASNLAAWILAEQRHEADAWPLARRAFLEAVDAETFLSSAGLLAQLAPHRDGSSPDDEAIRLQLETLAPILPRRTVSPLARPPPRQYRWASIPGEGIVAFYRYAIRPAIGSRCSLTPSCSEYFKQASRKHPLLALPLIADRLVREPGVVKSEHNPVEQQGHLCYSDPLSDHDFWIQPP